MEKRTANRIAPEPGAKKLPADHYRRRWPVIDFPQYRVILERALERARSLTVCRLSTSQSQPASRSQSRLIAGWRYSGAVSRNRPWDLNRRPQREQRGNTLIISPLSQLPPVQEILVVQCVMRLLVVFSLLTVKPRQTASNQFDARIFVYRNFVPQIKADQG